MTLNWAWLLLAIACEVTATTCLRFAEGFTRPLPRALMVACYTGSFYLLSLAVQRIELGVAYAVWAGLGTALVAIIGILFLHEPVTTIKVVCFGMIVLGAMGLHAAEATASQPGAAATAGPAGKP